MTIEMTLDEAINNYPYLIGELDYSCYRYNRQRSPDITPEGWKIIFSNVDVMEKRYQAEINGNITKLSEPKRSDNQDRGK